MFYATCPDTLRANLDTLAEKRTFWVLDLAYASPRPLSLQTQAILVESSLIEVLDYLDRDSWGKCSLNDRFECLILTCLGMRQVEQMGIWDQEFSRLRRKEVVRGTDDGESDEDQDQEQEQEQEELLPLAELVIDALKKLNSDVQAVMEDGTYMHPVDPLTLTRRPLHEHGAPPEPSRAPSPPAREVELGQTLAPRPIQESLQEPAPDATMSSGAGPVSNISGGPDASEPLGASDAMDVDRPPLDTDLTPRPPRKVSAAPEEEQVLVSDVEAAEVELYPDGGEDEVPVDDAEDEDEEVPPKKKRGKPAPPKRAPAKRKPARGKSSTLSKDFIDESDASVASPSESIAIYISQRTYCFS